MTQCDRIIQYCIDFGSITTRDAFIDLGVARLASRIHDLKKKGYDIQSSNESVLNRYGEKCTIKRYTIGEKTNVIQ